MGTDDEVGAEVEDEAEILDGIPKDLPAGLVEEEDPSSGPEIVDETDENASADDDDNNNNNSNNDDDNVAGDVDNSIPNDLPDSWVEEEDPSSGQIYFYNSTTGETSWERPMNTEEVEVNSLDRLNGTEPFNNEEEDDNETEGDASTTSNNLPTGWVEQEDTSSGQIYFYNSTTGETSRDRPTNKEEEEVGSLDGLNETEPLNNEEGDDNETEGDASNESDNLPDGWVEQEDPLCGQVYFYNATSGVTSWERPTEEEEDTFTSENLNGVEEGPSRNNNDDDP